VTAIVEQVEFQGQTLWAASEDGAIYVAVKPICEALGLSLEGQRQRIKRDEVLSEGACVIHAPSPGGVQPTYSLRLDLLNGWLFGIDDRRVRDAATRERVLTYKRECYRVLFEHFHGRAAEAVGDAADGEERAAAAGPLDLPADARIWVELVREARLLRGRPAAEALWLASPLPPLPEGERRDGAAGGGSAGGADPAARAIGTFLAERTEPAPGHQTPAGALYRAYAAWCADHALDPVTTTAFGRALGARGYAKRKAGTVFYTGLRVREARAAAPADEIALSATGG